MQGVFVRERWNQDHSMFVLKDFQNLLLKRFGSIRQACKELFDAGSKDAVNIVEFRDACKEAGFLGDPDRIWNIINIAGTLDISIERLRTGFEARFGEPMPLEED